MRPSSTAAAISASSGTSCCRCRGRSSRPSAVIAFVHSWNASCFPLVVLNSRRVYPWPLGIMVYQGEYSTDWNLILAFITLTILPAMIVFFARATHIVAGLTAGAVKG